MGRYASSHQAELIALTAGLHQLADKAAPTDTVAAFTDGQSVLTELMSGPPRAVEHEAHQLWHALERLIGQGTRVILHYVPSHVGVPGNERADTAASDEAALNSKAHLYPTIHMSCRRTCSIVKQDTLQAGLLPKKRTIYWKRPGAWGQRTLRETPRRPPKSHVDLTRRGEATIRSLRVGRHPLLVDYTQPGWRRQCSCGQLSTLPHIFTCARGASERHQLPTTDPVLLLFDHPLPVLRYLSRAGFIPDEMDTLLLTS